MSGKILVIDDDTSITELIQAILSKDGYEVEAAHNGVDGLAMAKEIKPDLIFMDIVMPDMDGYETTQEIKKIDYLQHVPVVFLSGYSENEDGGRSFEMGGASFIRKPFTIQQIRDFVKLAMLSVVE